MRFRGQTPWERHPAGDELLHVIEGAVEVTVLTDDGPVRRIHHRGLGSRRTVRGVGIGSGRKMRDGRGGPLTFAADRQRKFVSVPPA